MARPRVEDERQEQILAAFEQCVAHNGLAKTTLQNVADEAGLPRPLVRYFVGNRDEMVGLLIDRMVERAEGDLREMHGAETNVDSLLDFLFTKVFANELTNKIVDELWHLAVHDADIQARLSDMYTELRRNLAERMLKQGLGRSAQERTAAAHALMSLAYGEASFSYLNVNPPEKTSMRTVAGVILKSLSQASPENRYRKQELNL